jgi:hypothetical protein
MKLGLSRARAGGDLPVEDRHEQDGHADAADDVGDDVDTRSCGFSPWRMM